MAKDSWGGKAVQEKQGDGSHHKCHTLLARNSALFSTDMEKVESH